MSPKYYWPASATETQTRTGQQYLHLKSIIFYSNQLGSATCDYEVPVSAQGSPSVLKATDFEQNNTTS